MGKESEDTSRQAAKKQDEAPSDSSEASAGGGPVMGGMSSEPAVYESAMNVTLSDAATLKGAISEADLTMAISDGSISFDNITSVGVITDTKMTTNNYGKLNVELKNGASWTVTEASYMHKLVISADSKVTTESGNLYATVNGEAVTLESGKTYEGVIVVSPTEISSGAVDTPTQTPATGDQTTEVSTEKVKTTIKANKTSVKYGKASAITFTADSKAKVTVKAKNKLAKKAIKKKTIKITKNKAKKAKVKFTKKAVKGVYSFKASAPAKGNYKKASKTIKIKVK